MLSVAKVASAGGAAAYYSHEDNYYFLGEQSTEWFGKGAEKLGLSGEIKKSDFSNILEGQLPDGSDLSYYRKGENIHRPGYDYTFSAPKSVSLLALVKEDKDVLEAHKTAVKKTMTEIESLASTRSTNNGVPVFNQTKNLVVALFTHDTNRNLDPQLHTHAIVANATLDQENNKFKTLSTDKTGNADGFVEVTWNNQVALGKLYRSFLKEELAKQGYEFENVGKNGLWEIKGIPNDVLKEFSSRRKEILESVGEKASNKSLTVAAKDTRKAKDFTNKEDVKEFWQEKWGKLLGDFDQDKIKTTPEQRIDNLRGYDQKIKAIDKVLPDVINDIANNKVKFSRSEIIDKVVDKVYFSGGGFSDMVSSRIDRLVENKLLVITDNKQNYFTTADHLKKEAVTISLISKLTHQIHDLKADIKSPIAQQIENAHSNFNLFNVRGKAGYDAKIVDDIQNLADENAKQHIIIVPGIKDKNNLRDILGKEPYVYTIKDYLKSSYAEKDNQIITLYRSEKMHLDLVSEILTNNYKNNNTTVLLDTGGRNQKGLIRDLAIDFGVKETLLKESEEQKNVVIMSNIDKNDQLDTAVKAYMNLAITNKNIVIQAAEATNSNTNLREKLTDKIRSSLLDNGLLGERTSTLLSKEPVFVKKDIQGKTDYSNPANYQKGYTLERINKGKTERWTITNVDRREKTIEIINEITGQKEKSLSMRNINSEYQIYKNVKEIEIRIGDKLHSMGKANGIRADQDLKVIGITKENIFTKQKIKLEDSNGKIFTINSGEETKLVYGYAEPIGRSQAGKKDVIISILQDNQTNDRTLSDIQKGSNKVLAITATNESVLAKRINLNNSQISLTKSLEKSYNAKSLNEIKEESLNIALSNPRIKREIDSHIESLQAKKDWVSFSGIELITSFDGNSRFTKQQITDYVTLKINEGEFLPVNGKSKDLYARFYLKESLETEKKLLAMMDKGVNTQKPILANAKELLENIALNSSQKKAAEMILTNQDRIVSLQGLAGVGKTYQLNVVADLINEHRKDLTIKALAPTHKAKEELLKSNKIKDGDTFANFLIQSEKNTEKFNKTLFIIDESSMIGNKTGQALLNTIAERGGRIILAGDHSQLSSLESGDIFRLGQNFSFAAKAEMKEIMRQSNKTLKNAVEAIAIHKDIRKSFEFINKQNHNLERNNPDYKNQDAIVEIGKIDKSETERNNEKLQYQKVAYDYVSRSIVEQNRTQVITSTNRHRIGLNEAIQEAKLENNSLKNGVELPIYRRENLSESDLKDATKWSINGVLKEGNNYYTIKSVDSNGGEVWIDNGRSERILNVSDSTNNLAIFSSNKLTVYEGDLIRLNVTDKNKTVENSALGTVISTENSKIKVDFGNGNIRTLDPINNQADRHFDLGYTITTMSSQGGSFNNVIMFVDTEMKNFIDMKNAYVDISRVKDHLQIYVSDVKEYINLIERNTGERLTAYEIDNNLRLQQAKDTWNGSKNLKDLYNFKDKFDDNILTHSSRLSFQGKTPELLLATTDENGRYTGNISLPVNPYRGEIDFDNVRLDTTDNARFVVLNQGDQSKEMEVLTISNLDKAIDMDLDTDKSVIVVLNDDDKNITLADVLEEKQKLNDDSVLQEENKELDKLNQELISENENILNSEIKEDIESAKGTDNNKLGNDEVNILHHHSEEKDTKSGIDKGVKEKELV